MSSALCTIEFENPKEVYRPGEIISGLVILDINCTNYILLKALSLQFSGYACTKWENTTEKRKLSRPQTLIDYREDYVSTTIYLIGSKMANATRFEPGKYRYNFMVNIPQKVPSTFDSPLGFIRYELIVDVDYGYDTQILCNVPVIIEQLKDLRVAGPSLQLPVESQKYELKSCIKFWQQPLQLYVGVPQTAFVTGEWISLHIKLTNHSKLKLETIVSNLNRIITYGDLRREKTSEKNTEVTTIATNAHDLYGKNLKQMQLLLEICVPETPPTMTADECKCINVSYELEVLATARNEKRSVRAIVPIVIGSVSLRSDAKVSPSDSDNPSVAGIRVAKSIEDLTLPSFKATQDNLSATQMAGISTSMGSLASSFEEANFMTAVQLNKKSRSQIIGDLNNFKPKYLYYSASDG